MVWFYPTSEGFNSSRIFTSSSVNSFQSHYGLILSFGMAHNNYISIYFQSHYGLILSNRMR